MMTSQDIIVKGYELAAQMLTPRPNANFNDLHALAHQIRDDIIAWSSKNSPAKSIP